MTAVLDKHQIAAYWREGYLVLPDALSPDRLTRLRQQFDRWKDESRAYSAPYGITLDNRPRFDLEPGHSAARPALRRISSPVEVSDVYLEVMRDSPALDVVAALIGPNVAFNNSKINSKQPGTATQVKFHQDFLFEPHSNEDLITVLYFLDDVTLENGPLMVVPGSHRGPMHEHWHDGVFTGAVSAEVAAHAAAEAVPCVGWAGTAVLMHTRLVHGSEANRTDFPRTLFICEYRAEDALPLQVNHIPSVYEGEVVRGVRTARVRATQFEMAMPEVPTGASFFDQQAKAHDG